MIAAPLSLPSQKKLKNLKALRLLCNSNAPWILAFF
jgi:hypothetical protein